MTEVVTPDDLNIVSAIKLRRNLLVKPGLGESTRISAYAVNKVDSALKALSSSWTPVMAFGLSACLRCWHSVQQAARAQRTSSIAARR